MDTYDVAHYTVYNSGGTFRSNLGVTVLVSSASVLHSDFAWVVAVTPDMRANGMARNKAYRVGANPSILSVQEHMWDFLRFYHDGTHTFGTWLDKGLLYIDHVVITSKTDAFTIAHEREEKAIYNLLTKETVTL